MPPAVVAFDPVGEVAVRDRRGRRPDAANDAARRRAEAAESFAARFGVDDGGPSAAALADRFGFRYEPTATGPAGRRTVTITGHGAARAVPTAERSIRGGDGELLRDRDRDRDRDREHGRERAPRDRSRRVGYAVPSREPLLAHADRVAMWAVALALLLIIAAATSAHAAGFAAGFAPR